MDLKYRIFLSLFLLSLFVFAQTDFRPGFIINLEQDTIYGEIDYRGDVMMSGVCRFKDKQGMIIEYSPNDIFSFRFVDSKYYISKNVNGTNYFLEYLIKGKLNVYYMRVGKEDRYYLDKENERLSEIPYVEAIQYVDDKQVQYKSTKHIGFLSYYLQDAPEFQTQIQSIKKPEHKTLIKLAEDYHYAVCKDEECIIYEKKQSFLNVNLEIVGGFVIYKNVQDFNKDYYIQMGLLTHFWMPRVNEKLYFRTGILQVNKEFNKLNNAIFKIPIQLEYIYPKGIVRPVMALGVNIYSPIYQSVALTGGLNIKINKSIFLGFNYDIDFNPNEKVPLIPRSILSQSVISGIVIKI